MVKMASRQPKKRMPISQSHFCIESDLYDHFLLQIANFVALKKTTLTKHSDP